MVKSDTKDKSFDVLQGHGKKTYVVWYMLNHLKSFCSAH
jgi:hypothetical protein